MLLILNWPLRWLFVVSLSQQQTGRLRRLIERVRAFSAGCCWGGRPLGSVLLWEKHKAALERILQIASSITITQVRYSKKFAKRFNTYKDIQDHNERAVVAGRATTTSMVRFAARVPAGGPPTLERSARYRSLVWSLRVPRYFGAGAKNLARARPVSFYATADRYHHTKQSWKRLEDYIHYRPKVNIYFSIWTEGAANINLVDSKSLFVITICISSVLSRSFGLREEYAEMIQLCRNCRCLFWRSLGHPCIADQDPAFQEKLADVDQASLHVPIPPQTFLKFFSLWKLSRYNCIVRMYVQRERERWRNRYCECLRKREILMLSSEKYI